MTLSDIYQIVAKQKGLPSFKVPAELTANQREALYDGTADYILANPDGFSLNYIEWAKKRKGSPFYNTPLEEYSISDKISDFTSEFINQGVKINEAVNPFSESNRNKVLWIAAAGVILYFVAPVIIKAFVASKNDE